MQNDNPFFAKTEPSKIKEMLTYFHGYCKRYPTITLFEIVSFFRSALAYMLCPILSIILLCMQARSIPLHFMGIIVTFIGILIIRNSPIFLPDSVKRLSIPSKSVQAGIDCLFSIEAKLQFDTNRLQNEKVYILMYKLGGIAITLIGILLFMRATHPFLTACSLFFFSLSALSEQPRYFYIAGFISFLIIIL
jgi:hypothetical protein